MRRLDPVRDQRGTTMVEVLVSTATGLVVLAALTTVIMVSLHGSARVSARVDATQRARIAVTRVMEQLHSACVTPKVAPIQAGSTGTSLRFIHAASGQGSAVAPNPTLTQISLENGTLKQTDWVATGGTSPTWTYSSTPTTRTLLTNVAPVPPSTGVFSYYASSNGSFTPTAQATPLEASTAAQTIQVRVALIANPVASAGGTSPVKDKNVAAAVRDGATLRLTPPSFNEAAEALPCQ